jgi:GT2 family glycosyltransferase
MPLGASIIIPSYRRPEPLRLTLEDLARLRAVTGEVLIVDQSPEPCFANAEWTLGNGLPVRVLRRPPGVVAARNFAATVARHEVLVFLDDDVRIDDAAFLERHLRNYDDPTVDAVCGQELSAPDFTSSAPDRSQFACLYEEAEFFNRRSPEARSVVHLSTCNCSVRKSSFEKVRGFDEAFAGNSYGDDTDLALRLAQAGGRILFDPGASVRHLHWRQGGLRLSDQANAASAFDRHLSSWLVYFRHVPPQWRRWFLWHRILRRQLLLKTNVWRLHRWPGIIAGILSSRTAARRLAARV